MQTFNLFTNTPDSLPRGKADFLLACSVTKTCEIEGITQAGIPGKIALTPTLDAEFLLHQKVFSLPDIAETPSGVPSPALITKAVANIAPFSALELLDLGLEIPPQNCGMHRFGIPPSLSIAEGANIDAKAVFAAGMEFGRAYELKGSYLILAESTPSGTTTAEASVRALGFDGKEAFSSSFAAAPTSIKQRTIAQALSHINDTMGNFEKLSYVSDNMLLFCAGFLVEATRRFHVVLAGGTQMAACLLIADKLREDILMRLKSENLTLATTAWVAKDPHAKIAKLLEQLSYTPHAIYTDFSFADTEIAVLKKYDEGEAKEGVGAGAALAYAAANNLTNAQVLNEIELILYGM